MFKVGDIVTLDSRMIGYVDDQRGVIEEIFIFEEKERAVVCWEKDGHNDGGSWRTLWLLKV